MKFRPRFISVVVVMMFIGIVNAQKEKYMATYIFQFTRYIDWSPAYKSGDFVIIVIGDATMFTELQNLAQSKKVGNQSIVVKNLKPGKEIPDANIVFVSSSHTEQIQFLRGQIGDNSTLIIAEQAGMAKKGAAISFLEDGDKIAFEVNKSYFPGHSLSLNNSLLPLAKNIF